MVAHNATITPKASAKKARKGHSTDVIENTSFVEIAINIKKAEVSSNFSSYQTLTTDVNSRRNYARTKLNKKWTLMSVHSWQAVKITIRKMRLYKFIRLT
jgi:CRISPR/Cas system-associated protein Cas10 (large subunit of type III CRISPR-Cas system)